MKLDNPLSICKQRVQQLETCFKINSLLNSQLELENLLHTIMKASKSVMKADACTLFLIDEDTGDLVFRIALSPVGELIKQIGQSQRLKIGEGIAGTVAKTGHSMIIKDAYKHPRFNPEYDKKTGFQTGSILCSPLKIKGQTIGVCQVIHGRKKRRIFNGKDLFLFRMFCQSAALAVQNARSHEAMLSVQRMEKDMEFASSVQQSFLPQHPPRYEDFQFVAKTIPARIVGGDYYDFILFDNDRIGVLLGDVSGKGVSAALLMARLMSDFRYVSRIDPEPERVLRAVNNILCERAQGGMFTTATYLLIDIKQKIMRAASAGHPPLFILPENGKIASAVKASGPPLGIVPNVPYFQEQFTLKRGDRVLLYSDGVTDPRNKDNIHFGVERLCAILETDKVALEKLIPKIERSIKNFVGDETRFDDLTLLAFEVL